MIQVDIFTDSEGNTRGIEVNGHAGYDESGRDIVCAAVSALTLNMANSVEAFTEDSFDGSVDEETGRFQFQFTDVISPESKLLTASLVLGLQNLEDSYGEEYIKIRFKEV